MVFDNITPSSSTALLRARFARFLGRNARLRGIDRFVRLVFSPDQSAAYVEGTVLTKEGTSYVVDTRSFLEWSLWVYGGYESEIQGLMRDWLRTGDVVVDIGANIGIHACALAKAVGPSGRVIAIEAVPELAERLRVNGELNGVRNITIVAKAASDRRGSAAFYPPTAEAANKGQGSLHYRAELEATPQLVELTTVDEILRNEGVKRVRVVKIDVEGHELAVLRGMAATLARCQPFVLVEFTPRSVNSARSELDELLAVFTAAADYSFYREGVSVPLTPERINDEAFTLVAIPRDAT